MTIAQESCRLVFGLCEDEILNCVGMCVETWEGDVPSIWLCGSQKSRLERAEPKDGKNE